MFSRVKKFGELDPKQKLRFILRTRRHEQTTGLVDLPPKIWTIHIRTEDDIVSDSVLLILVESVDDYSNPNNPLPH